MSNQLLRHRHSLDSTTFEAFYRGSWHGVDLMSIKNGKMCIQLRYDGSIIEETISSDYIRPRSRKASTFDCFHFLKTGVDVCVRSVHPITESLGREPESLWHDAKIISIKGDHYEDRCTCRFSVAFHKTGSLSDKLKRKSVTEVVNIENLAILQKLYCEPCDDGFHQWTSSEDCISSSRNKLSSGTFASEISWLIVLSILKGAEFNIELVQNKLLYRTLNDVQGVASIANIQSDGDSDVTYPASSEEIKIMRFQRSNENLRPKIGTFTLVKLEEKNVERKRKEAEKDPIVTVDCDSDVEILYDSVSLRRSKRLKTLPDRFTSYTSPNFDRPTSKKGDDDSDEIENSALIELDSSRDEYTSKNKRNNSGEYKTYGANFMLQETDVRFDRETRRSLSPSSFNPGIKGTRDLSEKNSHGALMVTNSRRKLKKDGNLTSRTDRFSWANQRKNSNRKKILSASECEEFMKRCLNGSEFPPDTEWAESSQAKLLEELHEFKWSPDDSRQIEMDENEDLWKEMDHSLSTLALIEQKKKLESERNVSITTTDEDGNQPCQHDYVLNEQIGMVCQFCNCVGTEIRDIAPKFFRNDVWTSSMERVDRDTVQWMKSYNLESDSFGDAVSSLEMSSEACDDVWSLIPDLRTKLHSHQKKAFEFIWRNIAGSLKPEEMNDPPEVTGGCVISHSPGSGKTLLMISFLVSYLKLFSKSRPLILAPKIAVCIWSQEFEKWGIDIPLHVIRPTESFRKRLWDPKFKLFATGDRRPSVKMMQVMDCLFKLKQWHEKPSVLLMSYSTFFAMTDEESKNECKKFMADMLRKTPGIMILDEGHNPRSTRSKLRKQLMKVDTEYRVLLSGTLFQNNFEEYFNTLSLARPRFVEEVIRKLGRKMYNNLCRNEKGDKKKARKERLARKLFIEEIGQKIESTSESERSQGFSLLNRTTSRLIDVYEGAICDQLPGLHVYTLMLRSSDIQWEILKTLQNSITQKRCPLELELLIQVGSMHPWLIKTIGRVGDYFSADELDSLERYKKNFQSGSKMKFVTDLVQKSTAKGEKVLIFCHNISPINFMVELFEIIFGWYRGEEVLVLQGDQELSEREFIMNKFNGNSRKSKVLIASTLACAEGISLTAASRVVLLDSEWNHSKTRQAIARAFRPGQERVVYVYRLLALGTWEEDKYHSNEWKAWLSKMIFLGRYIKFTSSRQVEDNEVEDEILKELVSEDPTNTVHLIMKQD